MTKMAPTMTRIRIRIRKRIRKRMPVKTALPRLMMIFQKQPYLAPKNVGTMWDTIFGIEPRHGPFSCKLEGIFEGLRNQKKGAFLSCLCFVYVLSCLVLSCLVLSCLVLSVCFSVRNPSGISSFPPGISSFPSGKILTIFTFLYFTLWVNAAFYRVYGGIYRVYGAGNSGGIVPPFAAFFVYLYKYLPGISRRVRRNNYFSVKKYLHLFSLVVLLIW
jgi:hypothetical protein